MYTIFIEYKIDPNHLKTYYNIHQHLQDTIKKYDIQQYKWQKAVDQPYLFVESMQVSSLTMYHQWKEQQTSDSPHFPWRNIFSYISGGSKKFNMWAFENVTLQDMI
ncbi:hypothetical protein [Caldalkalibacillus salinus]|uniref:hypothetical protein n=1 Tax=Caldalkalibacillus salinus TaxID=2803787 RepID=UPI0019232F30|nr:hypothetical protein [Caldalkalibacillus salinus]